MADVLVPDMGSDDPVDIAEILVKEGDSVQEEDSLVVIESAKASLEVPSPAAGKIVKIHASVGQSLKTGDVLMTIESSDSGSSETTEVTDNQANGIDSVMEKGTEERHDAPESASTDDVDVLANADQTFNIPDIGGDAADVIELSLKPGDQVKKDDTLIVLESAKATVEVPAEADGVLVKYEVNVGDSVSEGKPFVVISVAGAKSAPAEKPAQQEAPKQASAPAAAPQQASAPAQTAAPAAPLNTNSLDVNLSSDVHAGPAVRRLANKLGVNLGLVSATGPRGRILKEDVHAFVKSELSKPKATGAAGGTGLPALPEMDFSQHGEVEEVSLTKIQQMSAQNLHRAWVNIPHVTQFDEADITDLENFRKSLGEEFKKQGVKITMLAFMIKASVHALKAFPKFNASLHSDGKTLIMKKYYHIGFAADTPNGLVVPVIKNADRLSVVEIAQQLMDLSAKARDKKLGPKDMQGGCFTISSLGGIGGTAFTPIVNWPEVAILGVSRSKMQPVWNGKEFTPRNMLPLSLSYDHRVIDGADAARFSQYLSKLLGDARRMLL